MEHSLGFGRAGLMLGALAVLAALVVVLAPPARSAPMTMPMGKSHSMTGVGMRERFDYLSHQSTNSCMLQVSGFASMSPTARLQGACCGPMAYADYANQIPALASFNREHHTAKCCPERSVQHVGRVRAPSARI